MAQWRYVFAIAAALGVFTTIIFTIFGSGEAQSWNEPEILKTQKSRKAKRIVKVVNQDESEATQPLQNTA